jgi:hypothetical protein
MSAGKNVYVVLSRSQTLLSRIIHIMKGDRYTHAALSLDKNLEYMFSFGRRRASNPFIGCFRRERLDDGIYKFCSYLPGAVIKIPVSPVQYQNIVEQIEMFLLNSDVYGYNYFGLASNLVGKTHQVSTRFFCSEFVYHVLHQSGICDLKMPRGMVCPQDLMNLDGMIIFEGNLKKYRCQLDATALSKPLTFNFDAARIPS